MACDAVELVFVYDPPKLAETEMMLREGVDERIEKLVLLLGVPPTVEDLQTNIKETFGISDYFSLWPTLLLTKVTKLNTNSS